MRPPRKLDNFKRPLHRLFGRIGREYFFAWTLTARQPLTLGLAPSCDFGDLRRDARKRCFGLRRFWRGGFGVVDGLGSVSPLMGALACGVSGKAALASRWGGTSAAAAPKGAAIGASPCFWALARRAAANRADKPAASTLPSASGTAFPSALSSR